MPYPQITQMKLNQKPETRKKKLEKNKNVFVDQIKSFQRAANVLEKFLMFELE